MGIRSNLPTRGQIHKTDIFSGFSKMSHALDIRCVLMALSYLGFSIEPSLYAKVYGLRHSISLTSLLFKRLSYSFFTAK